MEDPKGRIESDPIAEDTADISFKGEIMRKTTHIGALLITGIYYLTSSLELTHDYYIFYGVRGSNFAIRPPYAIFINCLI